jgi:hypothetical protein
MPEQEAGGLPIRLVARIKVQQTTIAPTWPSVEAIEPRRMIKQGER